MITLKKNIQLNYFAVAVMYVFMVGTVFAQNPKGCFPGDKLPPYISLLTYFGERSEWSHDGKTVYFVDKSGSEIWKVDLKSKVTTQI